MMVRIVLFFAAVLVTYILTRVSNRVFVRAFSERTSAIFSFVLWGGIAAVAMAGRIIPPKIGFLLVVTPLLLWLVIDLSRAGKQTCPECGRRVKPGLLACPWCGRSLGTGARVEP